MEFFLIIWLVNKISSLRTGTDSQVIREAQTQAEIMCILYNFLSLHQWIRHGAFKMLTRLLHGRPEREAHFHPVPGLRIVELCLQSPTHLQALLGSDLAREQLLLFAF
jgi:hypothetical protein